MLNDGGFLAMVFAIHFEVLDSPSLKPEACKPEAYQKNRSFQFIKRYVTVLQPLPKKDLRKEAPLN
jgi:hypothetical protein